MTNYIGSVPDTLARRHDWMGQMACLGQGDMFFDKEQELDARVVCVVRCPVRAKCLAHVKRVEGGAAKDQRDGVVAGLTGNERWRLDATAPGHADRPALVFTGEPDCGTYTALLRHLWLGERIDPECWSAEVRRDRGNRMSIAAERERKQAENTAAVPQAPPEPAPAAPKPRPCVHPPAKGDTPHERRVYRLWAEGYSDLQIARRMAISTPQVQRVRERLGLIANLHTARAS